MKMIKKAKKGFTLIELVVVIAVIAILSGVSVVAYVGITNNAKKSAAMQEARAAYNSYYAIVLLEPEHQEPTIDILHKGYIFHVTAGSFDVEPSETNRPDAKDYNVDGESLKEVSSTPAPSQD